MRSLKRSAAPGHDSDADTASDDEEDGDEEEDGDAAADGNDSDGDRPLPRAVDEEEELEEGGADALLAGPPATSAFAGGRPGITSSSGYVTRVGRLLTAAEAEALAAATDKAPSWAPVGDAMPGAALAPLHGPQGVTSVTWEVCASGIEPPQVAAPASLAAAAASLPTGLAARWLASLRAQQQQRGAAGAAVPEFASPIESSLWGQLASYRDVLFTARSPPPVPCASDPVLDACLLHALGHCLAGRAEVLRHNERLRSKAKASARSTAADAVAAAVATGQLNGGAAADMAPEGEVPQDQGFTRPKLLVLCPTRAWAKRWLDRALHLLPCANTGAGDCVGNAERWEAQYGPRLDEAGPNPRSTRHKPPDFSATFFGNRDDHFRLGVKLTARSVRLFADFVGADIVLASPLGLATRLEAGDASFLSSIELCILDGADVMLQQNWAHVETVFAALNALPTAQDPDLDVMRVRPWYLDGQARHYRQTVVLAAHGAPQLSALVRRHCTNWAGQARLKCTFTGVLASLGASPAGAPLSHSFTRVAAPDAASAADARFAHFKSALWPRLSASPGGELLLVPSYFDFVRLRNFLSAQGASFATYCEYTDPGEVGSARRDFGDREAKLMVHTQRAWFFRRHVIKGAARLTFYGPPDVTECYAALATALAAGGSGAGGEVREVETLFTRWDAPQLERIVGTKRCAKMLAPGGSGQFLFC